MPLSRPQPTRTRLHTPRVTYECFRRDDGLFELEAHLTDVKDHDYVLLTGVRRAGDAVHDMWARVTVGRDYVVRAIDVSTESMPYPGACDRIEPAYARLVCANLLN